MIISATEFKNKVGKYLKLVGNEEIIISKNGKLLARILPVSNNETPLTESLIGALSNTDIKDINNIREKRHNKL